MKPVMARHAAKLQDPNKLDRSRAKHSGGGQLPIGQVYHQLSPNLCRLLWLLMHPPILRNRYGKVHLMCSTVEYVANKLFSDLTAKPQPCLSRYLTQPAKKHKTCPKFFYKPSSITFKKILNLKVAGSRD